MTLQHTVRTDENIATAIKVRPSRRRAGEFAGRTAWSPDRLSAEAAPYGLRIATPDELLPTHSLAETIMGMRLAPLWALGSAQAHTGASAWVHAMLASPDTGQSVETITGLFLLLPLNWDGEAALRNGRFNFAAPRMDHLCAPGEEAAGLYFWLSAGLDGRARRNVVRTALAWLDGSCAGLRIYARAASGEGERALAGLQFQRLAEDRPGLFFRDMQH